MQAGLLLHRLLNIIWITAPHAENNLDYDTTTHIIDLSLDYRD